MSARPSVDGGAPGGSGAPGASGVPGAACVPGATAAAGATRDGSSAPRPDAPPSAVAAGPAGRPRRPVLAALALITALGFALRLANLDYLLPARPLGDGSVPVAQIEVLRTGADPHEASLDAAYYPYLHALVAALLPREGAADPDRPRTVEEHLACASSPWVEARLASVLLSMLAVPLAWWLARRFVGDAGGLLAAAWLATSLLHADFSAQERPHGLVTSTILLAVIAAIRLRRVGDVASHLLAGVAAGLAVGSLQNGAAALPAIGVALLLPERGPRRASRWWALAGIAILAAFVRWLYPFHFSKDPLIAPAAEEDERGLANFAGHEVFLGEFNGYGFRRIVETLWSYDPLFFLATIAGLALLALRWRARRERPLDRALVRDALVVAGFALPYLAVTGMYLWTLERFALPLYPVLAILAGHATWRGALAAASALRAPRLAAPLAAAVPLVAGLPAAQLARLRVAPDAQEVVADWVRGNVRWEQRMVIVPYVDLPLLYTWDALEGSRSRGWASHWLNYQLRLDPEKVLGRRHHVLLMPGERNEASRSVARDPLEYFARHRADYVAIALPDDANNLVPGAREALRREGQLVLRVTPEADDSGRGMAVLTRHVETITHGPLFARPYALELFDYERLGWAMEVYRLRR